MNIFLTGGTGFIGSYLLRLLGTTDHKVTAIRRCSSRPCIDIGRDPLWLVKEMNSLEPIDFTGIDVLVHLASIGVSPKTATLRDLLYWNVSVMANILEMAHTAGVRRFILAGSSAEYGIGGDRYDFIPIDAPLLPTSPYAASKAAGFIVANTFAIDKTIELHYLRIFSAYGEGQYIKNFWPSLRAAALNGEDFPMTPGGQIRDFMPVERVVEAFLTSIEGICGVQNGVPFVANVGSGNPMSMLEFAEQCWAEWGAKGKIIAGAIPYRPNEPMRVVPKITKIAT
jgi:nucleoside-diphosphate-sugar epimerase